MKIQDRLYWFFRNLSAFILCLPFIPVTVIIKIFRYLYIVIFITDGSTTIMFPWEMAKDKILDWYLNIRS